MSSDKPVLPDSDFFPELREGFNVAEWGEWERINGRPFRRSVLDDGRPVLIYDNGAIKSAEGQGAWIVASPEHSITRENAHMYTEKRLEMAEQAFMEGLANASGHSSFGFYTGAVKAWGKIGEAQYKIAADPSRGRSSTEAAKFIGRAAGFLVDDKAGQGEGGLTIQVSAGAVADLVAALRGRSLGSGE